MFNVNADCEYMGVLLKTGEYGVGNLEESSGAKKLHHFLLRISLTQNVQLVL